MKNSLLAVILGMLVGFLCWFSGNEIVADLGALLSVIVILVVLYLQGIVDELEKIRKKLEEK